MSRGATLKLRGSEQVLAQSRIEPLARAGKDKRGSSVTKGKKPTRQDGPAAGLDPEPHRALR